MTLSMLQSHGGPFLLKLLVSLAGLSAVARYWYVVGLGEGRRVAQGVRVHVTLDQAGTLDAYERVRGQLDRLSEAVESTGRREEGLS